MSALNKDESDSLRAIGVLLEEIAKGGYNPNDVPAADYKGTLTQENHRATFLQAQLELARRRLRTIVMMKGYYSK